MRYKVAWKSIKNKERICKDKYEMETLIQDLVKCGYNKFKIESLLNEEKTNGDKQ